MKLYADTPGRRAAQIVADLLFVFWLVLWVWVGNQVHDTTRLHGRHAHVARNRLGGGVLSFSAHRRLLFRSSLM